MNSPEEQPGSFVLTDFQDKSSRGRVRMFFSTEQALITAKYLSYCQVSWCQLYVVINIHMTEIQRIPLFILL